MFKIYEDSCKSFEQKPLYDHLRNFIVVAESFSTLFLPKKIVKDIYE
jgi:hypothetical protein